MRPEDSPSGNTDVSLLRRVSRIVNSDLSVDEMLGQIVMLTAQVCACDACIVYLLESATGDFVLRASQVPHPRIGNLQDAVGRRSHRMGGPAPIAGRADLRRRLEIPDSNPLPAWWRTPTRRSSRFPS